MYEVFESRMNNFTEKEIITFGNYLLEKISLIKSNGNEKLIDIYKSIFEGLERDYPEKYLIGVYKYYQNGDCYYRFNRVGKRKNVIIHSKSAHEIYNKAVEFSIKYNVRLYKLSSPIQ